MLTGRRQPSAYILWHPTEDQKEATYKFHPMLTAYQATYEVMKQALSVSATRAIYSLCAIGMGRVLAMENTSDAVSSGPLIMALQGLFVNIPRSSFQSVRILASGADGAGHPQEVGKICFAGWQYATIVTLCSVPLLLSTPEIMFVAGIADKGVKNYLFRYLAYTALGSPVGFISTVDKLIPIAIGKAPILIACALLHTGLTMGLGFPAAVGHFGRFLEGERGYAVSTSLATWVVFGFLRWHFHFKSNEQGRLFQALKDHVGLEPDYANYHLLEYRELCHRSSSWNEPAKESYLYQVARFSSKFGFQATAEIATVVLSSVILSTYSSRYPEYQLALAICAPALQIVNIWGIVTFAFGNALSSLIKKEVGKMQQAKQYSHLRNAKNAKHNIHLQALIGIIIGVLLSSLLALCCWFAPYWLTGFFLAKDMPQEAVDEANDIVQICALSLMIDGARNILAGNLTGFEDINFATINCLAFMFAFGNILGGYLLLSDQISLKDYMWLRNLSIFIPMVLNACRWMQYDRLPYDKQWEKEVTVPLLPFFKQTTDHRTVIRPAGYDMICT